MGSHPGPDLSLLHRQGVVLPKVDLQQIGVDEGVACWTSLETARVLTPQEQAQAPALFAQNVAGLATVLLYLATGRAWNPQRPGPVPPGLDILVPVLQSPTTSVPQSSPPRRGAPRNPASPTPGIDVPR